MLKDIKSWIIISLTFLIIVWLVWISYAALSSLKASSTERLTVSKWDALVDHSVPSGAINAFYLSSCPTGWKAADGTNSTPDLRWQFLRWLNDFGTGLRTDWNENPETKALWEYQADEVWPHSHPIDTALGSAWSTARYAYWDWASYNRKRSTNSYSSDETRPKNVSVIFCIKE